MPIELSVLIPTFNKSKYLDGLLHSLSKQTMAADRFEIVVVDDGSSDETKLVVERHLVVQKNIRYHYQINAGISAARNTGIRLAKGDLISFLADDYVVPENYCEKMASFFKDPLVQVVKPRMKTTGTSVVERASLHLYENHLSRQLTGLDLPATFWPRQISFPNSLTQLNGVWELSGAAMMRRSLFERFGVFNTSLATGEDTDMGRRLVAEGVRAYLCPNIFVNIFFRARWSEALKRAHTYGCNARILREMKDAGSAPHLSSPWKLTKDFLGKSRHAWHVSLHSGSYRSSLILFPYIYLHMLSYALGFRGFFKKEN